ncbi:class I SAM-dependent methyltransferase [Microbacterium sp. USHLN186]|uniref:class I SAM-dependent methyltransferase n=1 Tax=Microbacterium sp. USHLN186 TaxID=3081286 RepID=UPI003017E152
MTQQEAIDARIQSYYAEVFDEHARLTTRSPQGPVEFLRTQEIVRARLAPGRVVDIGGGSGIHARALQRDGFDVQMIDPVPRHVEQARSDGLHAQVADAREVPFPDDVFDGALMLGPLYHLSSRDDRLQALREAARVVAPGGFVFAAGLSRYIAFGMATLGRPVPEPYPAEWTALTAHGTPPAGLRFPAGHFHTAEELGEEVSAAGLRLLEVVGVEGPAGGLLESVAGASAELIDASLTVARAAASVPGIRDMSAHLIAVAQVDARRV